MEVSDLTRFEFAQEYYRQPRETRDQRHELAEAGSWFERLCTRLIGREVRGTMRCSADEDDRINQVWVALLRKLPSLRYCPERGPLSAWLRQIVRHLLISVHRRSRRPMAQLDDALAGMLVGRDDVDNSQRTQLGREVRAAIEAFRCHLSSENHALIELHWLKGLGLEDSAKLLGLTPNEAKCRQRRTLRKLSALLSDQLEWPYLSEWIRNHPETPAAPYHEPPSLLAS